MRKLGFLVIALAASQVGSTDCGQVLGDRGFDLWCGERLCKWELEKGEIRPAPTWHDGDTGVELVGDDVAISQLAPANDSDGLCMRVTMVADIEESAEVRLLVDVFGDGSIESDERIPTSDWRKLTFLVRMPVYYDGVRFRLTKRGGGRAVLANIGAEIVIDEACMGPPLAADAPAGARCGSDAECASGDCFEWLGDWPDICGTCDEDADCSGGELCTVGGTAPAHLSVATHCMPPGALPDGRSCLRDAHCASGLCVDGVCGECRSAAECGGAACLPGEADFFGNSTPARCDRGRGPGASCFHDSHCDSGVCAGDTLFGCGSLNRDCASDADCPDELVAPEDRHCVPVGIARGVCQ